MISGPGVLAEGQAVDHLGGADPAVVFDRTLEHIGQHRVGAAERQQRSLGEEPAHLGEGAFGAEGRQQQPHGQRPQHPAHQEQDRQPTRVETRVGRHGRVVVDQGRPVVGHAAGVTARLEARGRQAPADPADQAGAQHHQGERRIQGEHGEEGDHGQQLEARVMQGARADAPGGVQHQRGDGRFDAPEHPGHQGLLAIHQVGPGQADQQHQGRQHEQYACQHAAQGAVHQPAQVGGQLLGLRPGQDHAVVEGMQEAPL